MKVSELMNGPPGCGTRRPACGDPADGRMRRRSVPLLEDGRCGGSSPTLTSPCTAWVAPRIWRPGRTRSCRQMSSRWRRPTPWDTAYHSFRATCVRQLALLGLGQVVVC